jgi:hypothetical protein
MDGFHNLLRRQPFWHLTTVGFWRLIPGMNDTPQPHHFRQPQYAIVFVRHYEPPSAAGWPENWQNFLGNKPHSAKAIAKTSSTSGHVYIIQLRNELLTFCELIVWCKQFQIPFQVEFLEEVPAWLNLPPDDEPTKKPPA